MGAPLSLADAGRGGGQLEIRPLFEAEDLGEVYTPELRAQEERQRAAIEARSKS